MKLNITNQILKILWILKEANSTGENESWDMRDHINEKLKTETGIRKGLEPNL